MRNGYKTLLKQNKNEQFVLAIWIHYEIQTLIVNTIKLQMKRNLLKLRDHVQSIYSTVNYTCTKYAQGLILFCLHFVNRRESCVETAYIHERLIY